MALCNMTCMNSYSDIPTIHLLSQSGIQQIIVRAGCIFRVSYDGNRCSHIVDQHT